MKETTGRLAGNRGAFEKGLPLETERKTFERSETRKDVLEGAGEPEHAYSKKDQKGKS